jgi:hypothetical protein
MAEFGPWYESIVFKEYVYKMIWWYRQISKSLCVQEDKIMYISLNDNYAYWLGKTYCIINSHWFVESQ